MTELDIFSILGIAFCVMLILTPKFEKLLWPFLLYAAFMFVYLVSGLAFLAFGCIEQFTAVKALAIFGAIIGFKFFDVMIDLVIGKV